MSQQNDRISDILFSFKRHSFPINHSLFFKTFNSDFFLKFYLKYYKLKLRDLLILPM